MNEATRQRIRGVIARHRLHDGGAPVDLSPLTESFAVFDTDFGESGVAAVGVPPLAPGEPSPENPAGILIDARLSPAMRRLAYAHEIGHVACGHVGTLAAREINASWHDKQEEQAWEAAAKLLVPLSHFDQGETLEEIAAACRVPVGLVERHPWLGHMRTMGRAAVAIMAALVTLDVIQSVVIGGM